MPIIINGGSRSAGGWWAKHLENGEKNERVAVIEVVGLSAATIPDAFREMEGVSLGSKCTNYFYQANINPRADERLTPAQWREAVDTLEKNLGLTGQPRFVVEHEKEGRTHRHVVWSRIDPERMTAISDSLTAAIHERTSRALEIKFDLERGQSILVPDRKTERPDRRPKKHETFRSMDSGIDPETVKADARRHWRSADNGQSFKAALEASGDYLLARGDRRDFVIIDRAGDDHSLARRLGVKAAEMRARMADLDPASLPNVQEAKAQQQTRQAERDAGKQPDRAAEIAAAERAMQEARAAARGRTDDTRPEIATAANQNVQEPLTFEAIQRDPWQAVYAPLPNDADRSLLAAVVLCAGECKKFAATATRVLDVIDPERAEYTRDRHAEAAARQHEAQQRLGALPPEQITKVSPFLHPEQVQDKAMENLGAAISQRQEEIGPRGPITAEALDQNPWNAVVLDVPSQGDPELLDRIGATAQALRVKAILSAEAASSRLEATLWTIAGEDAGSRWQEARHEQARRGDEIERQAELAMRAERHLAKGRYDELRTPHQDGPPEIDAQSERAESRRPEIGTAFTAAAQEATQQPAPDAGRAGEPEPSYSPSITASVAAEPATEIRPADRVAGRIFGGIASMAESMLGGLFSFFGGAAPKLTQQQARDQAKADTNEETLHARAYDAAMHQKQAEADERIFNQDRQRQQEDFAARYGVPGGSSGRDRERDDDRGRERER